MFTSESMDISTAVPITSRRTEELELLDKHFCSGECVAIYGVGGIGKTSLVRTFISSYKHYKSSIFYPFNRDTEEQLRERLNHELNKLSQKDIFVLEDSDCLSEEQVAYVKSQAASNGVFLIIVSRHIFSCLNNSPSITLSGIGNEEVITILEQAHGTTLPIPLLNRALHITKNHPLAVNLLAKLIMDQGLEKALNSIEGDLTLRYRDSLSKDKIIAVLPIIVDATEYLIEELRDNPDKIFKIKPRDFEKLIAKLLQNFGWDVELTKETRDGGRDILAFMDNGINQHLCLVETKRYSPKRPVSIGLVRELWGTLCDEQATSAMLVTTSYFSPEAIKFERKYRHRLALNDYSRVTEWIKRFKT